MPTIAVQIISPDTKDLSLRIDERKAVTESLDDSLNVYWLPPKERIRFEQGSHYTTAILLFLLGLPISAAIGEYFKGFFSEAGKDTYSQLKKLISRIWRRQADKSYALVSTAYIIFEFGEEHIGFHLPTPRITETSEETELELERLLDTYRLEIEKSLSSIEADINRFDIGKRVHESTMHLVLRGENGRWAIHGVDSFDFSE
jgi:hypothetical protein